MKKYILLTAFLICSTLASLSQDPPPPPPTNPSNGGGPVGGGAPVGSGIVLLIALAAGYGGKKAYRFLNKKEKYN